MATIQMNVRMDAAIKPIGDEAFASIGYTPSSLIQALWRFASRNRHNRKALRELRTMLETDSLDEEAPQRSWVESTPLLYEQMLRDMGIEGTPAPLQLTDEELLFQAHLEKAAEREMLE